MSGKNEKRWLHACGAQGRAVFEEVNGEPTYLRQKIQFKGMYISE